MGIALRFPCFVSGSYLYRLDGLSLKIQDTVFHPAFPEPHPGVYSAASEHTRSPKFSGLPVVSALHAASFSSFKVMDGATVHIVVVQILTAHSPYERIVRGGSPG